MKNEIDIIINSKKYQSGFVTKEEVSNINEDEIISALSLQTKFLEEYSTLIPSIYKNKWPINKMGWWSRPSEYIYVIRELYRALNHSATVLEFGPGCSFLTYQAMRCNLIHRIDIIDIDSSVIGFWSKVSNQVKCNLAIVDSIEDLKESEYDVIYSVSVLEHLRDPVAAVSKLIRALKSNGRLILTMDIDLTGNSGSGLTPKQLEKILTLDGVSVAESSQFVTIHPSSLATPMGGWFNKLADNIKPSLLHLLKQYFYNTMYWKKVKKERMIGVIKFTLSKN